MGYFSGGYSLSESGPETDLLLDEIAKVVFCQYGVTEYNDALTKYNAGKGLCAIYNKKTYLLTDYTNSTFYFAQLNRSLGYASLSLSASGWAVVDSVSVAPLNSPVFTGTPTAPTADANTNNEQIATTAYADRASYASLMEDTASGSIASFPDGAENVPVKELTADIEPIQDLHGYSNPWHDGGGSNLVDIEKKTTAFTSVPVLLQAGTYYAVRYTSTSEMNSAAHYSATIDGTYTLVRASDDNDYAYCDVVMQWGKYQSIITIKQACYIRFVCNSNDYSNPYSLMLTKDISVYNAGAGAVGSTVYNENFKPYSNICPISGYTGAEITVTGKNLYNKNGTGDGFVAGKALLIGDVLDTNQYFNVSEYIKIKPSTTYTLQGLVGNGAALCFYDANKGYISGVAYLGEATKTVTSPATAAYIRFSASVANADTIQLEEGSSATAYEAFGTVYSIDWTDEAGTVYGGNINATEGDLEDNKGRTDLGGLNWSLASSGYFYAYFPNPDPTVIPMCEILKGTTEVDVTTTHSTTALIALTSSGNVIAYAPQYATAADFKTAMTGYYFLWQRKAANIVSYSVEPTEVTTLLGDNNIWSNTGDISVKYRCNTALYILKITGA